MLKAATRLLGVDAMTGHWEFTYGQTQMLSKIVSAFHGDFVAHNIQLKRRSAVYR
jgi:S-sulfosulfanyl-L-cysteine sulfohydrolase